MSLSLQAIFSFMSVSYQSLQRLRIFFEDWTKFLSFLGEFFTFNFFQIEIRLQFLKHSILKSGIKPLHFHLNKF